ncbi:Uma2 family endonuclease [Embleya sp. AB8]|uniref:Uma2 family endonuclease n=1 Tax=Embleya sp. AB8 TaxID=3156304 RepID=UPI003C716F28
MSRSARLRLFHGATGNTPERMVMLSMWPIPRRHMADDHTYPESRHVNERTVTMDTHPSPDEGAEMTALAHEQDVTATLDDYTARPTAYIAGLRTPQGVRVEYIEGKYHMNPPANDEHNRWATRLVVQLFLAGLEDVTIGNGFCTEPGEEKHITGAFIPDFVVQYNPAGESDEAYRRNHDGWYPASMVRLACEITSPSNAMVDRGPKYRTYARAGIPVYLLVDREKGVVVVYSEPIDRGKDSVYQVAHQVTLGQKLDLPDGLPTLDTSALT